MFCLFVCFLLVFWDVILLVSQLSELVFHFLLIESNSHSSIQSESYDISSKGPRAGHKSKDPLIWRLCHHAKDTQLEDTVSWGG